MINLLSDTEKELLRREYARRRMVASLVLASITLLAGALLLVPPYYAAHGKYRSYAERTAGFGSDSAPTSTAAILATVRGVKDRLSLVKKAVPANVDDILAAVVEKKDKRVMIRSFLYESKQSDKGTAAVVTLGGTADTRDALIAYVNRLKQVERFAQVYSPISNLVKDKNIDYTIQISLNR